MKEALHIQGRVLTSMDIEFLQELIRTHPQWHRTRLSQEIARQWNWHNARGQLKDMACRTMLLKLEKKGILQLPPRQTQSFNDRRKGKTLDHLEEDTTPLIASLKALNALTITLAKSVEEEKKFNTLLQRYHYLGYQRTVGENLKYSVSDANGRTVTCLLFGSAAWSCASRDRWLGWNAEQRAQRLNWITNNTRFLIMPWVQVPHLASHILARIARRLSNDWENKYGHPIWLLETFVDLSRYQGTCYRAANWQCVGKTQGRSRNDRHHCLDVPVKAVYVYPLHHAFRQKLIPLHYAHHTTPLDS